MTIKSFKDHEGFHINKGCKTDHELKESVYTFEVRTKYKSGSFVREYKVLNSQMINYYNELLNREDTSQIYVY